MNFPLTWNLERIFPGGSQSPAFQNKANEIEKKLFLLEERLTKKEIKKALPLCEELQSALKEMSSFVECLSAQDVTDTKAMGLSDQMRQLSTQYSNLEIKLDALLGTLSSKDFDLLKEAFSSLAFHLEEKRKIAQEKLPPEKEAFLNDLAIDGYHSWWELWQVRIGEMSFPFKGKHLSFGQIENKLSNPDRKIRKEGFKGIQKTFCENERGFSQIMNHLGGFRLEIYRKRNWPLLKEALHENRMSSKTLDAMWGAISQMRLTLIKYFECKSDLLGLEKLSWYDLEAPLATTEKKISYDDAAQLIIKQFGSFSPKMGKFAKHALENHWIDAEDRKGKSPGGFCTRFPLVKESRIFMTFSNTMTNLFTLAHELGHAFHNEVLFDLPESAQDAKMGVAETASTMAEMIVTQAAIQSETDPKERLFLLDDHLSRAAAYLMNIYARFLYETRFYEKRKRGFVSDKELSKLMVEAQQEAYGNVLETYHPLFWAAKMHFFFTDVPFYNFPYTFGYLFSLGIYKHAIDRQDFESSYIALLRDTGQMTVEDLAKKHLQTDLTLPDFWKGGLKIIQKDIETFSIFSKEVKL